MEAQPKRLIGDKADDSDLLDDDLAAQGVAITAPYRRNRGKTHDGRPPRRYRRRWQVERLFAWPANFRRLNMRYDFDRGSFLGFVQLGLLLGL